ncbi:MAG: ribokinase [Kiritimatiellae bacterium]|nr:ribokinase [Kiritimatiellia bacterium]
MGKKIITVIGSTNVDMVISGSRIPVLGETVSGGNFMMAPGGKGANQAVAASRLAGKNGKCIFIAKVGDDLFGKDTKTRLKKDKIDTRLLVDKKVPSGTALILVDKKGQNCISVALGANGTLSAEDIAPFKKEIESSCILLMQLETPIETVVAAAKTAHEKGVKVILNPAPAKKLPKELYPLIDYITPNETEAELLTGVKVVDEETAAEATRILQKRGVKNVIITMGSKGCWCGNCKKIYPCKKAKAIDTVAAGDTFNGAFAVALAEGKNCSEAIDFAQKASAIAVTRMGAQPSIPFRDEIK